MGAPVLPNRHEEPACRRIDWLKVVFHASCAAAAGRARSRPTASRAVRAPHLRLSRPGLPGQVLWPELIEAWELSPSGRAG